MKKIKVIGKFALITTMAICLMWLVLMQVSTRREIIHLWRGIASLNLAAADLNMAASNIYMELGEFERKLQTEGWKYQKEIDNQVFVSDSEDIWFLCVDGEIVNPESESTVYLKVDEEGDLWKIDRCYSGRVSGGWETIYEE